MTKQQPSATMSPSRLCRLLLLLLTLKIVVLGLLFMDPGNSGKQETGLIAGLSGLLTGAAGSPAEAATGDNPAAPPPVEATLPDTGINSPGPGAPGSSPGAPGALPAIQPRQDNGTGSLLPPIDTTRPPTAPGAVNGTASVDRDNLARRQEDLARKEQELRVLEGELSKKLEQMQMLESRISMMMKEAEGAQDAKYRHLVDVLSNMKAKQAATVLETLDPKIAVKVLAGMRGRQAGEILTFVNADRAAQLTEALARMQLPLE